MTATPDISDMMKAYSLDAVDLAQKQFACALDYSVASVRDLERILKIQHAALPKGWRRYFQKGPSEDTLRTFSKIWGGYLGEVIRREWGGEWQVLQAGPFQGAVGLVVKDQQLVPSARVYKRLTMGFENGDVWGYINMLRSSLGAKA